LTVFSVNARVAWAHLRALKLVHQKSHRLVEAQDVHSLALADVTHIVTEGIVFMYPHDGGRIPVVEVMPTTTGLSDRIVTLVGYLRPRHSVENSSLFRGYRWEPPDGVTDAMLKAALNELDDEALGVGVYDTGRIYVTHNDMRRTIKAALAVRREEFGSDT